MNYICWTRPNSICWSVLREIRAHGSDRDFWSLEIVYGRNFGHHCLRIRATNIKCSWPHYKFTWTFQMSVQFLEARACQRHDLGEPVFGDGVLSMIVVPRRFSPCDWLSEVKTQLWTPRKACSLAKSFGIPTVGRQPRSQGKGGTLETTKSILSDNNMVFCIQKEANESVHRRWSYLVGSSKLSPSLLPSRNILQPNKRNTNPTNIKTYTTERSDYKLKIMLLFHCKTP